MRDLAIPDLTFPLVKYGRLETPWDLRVLLYKGGAKGNSRTVFNQIAAGELGRPLIERIELVTRIHEAMTAKLVGGGAKQTEFTILNRLRRFVSWSEGENYLISLEEVETAYRYWCDFLIHRERMHQITSNSAYSEANGVSGVLSDALERSTPLIRTTRLRRPKEGARAVGVSAEKQDLGETFAFSRLCLDVVVGLPIDVVFGALPATINLRGGFRYDHWSGRQDMGTSASRKPGYLCNQNWKRANARFVVWESDRSIRTRFSIVNLRIEAELLIFIAQTGMNKSQAQMLRKSSFSYKSTIDGYEVREYKERRKGEVLFEIFSEYKEHFDRYLAWRDKVFAGELADLLFPFVRRGARDSTPREFWQVRNLCKAAGIVFVGPKRLRNTRVNWLLRESRNPEQTAEQAQHTKQTLLRVYERPSIQVAQVEIIQFWKKNDPRLVSNPMPCPAPGVCDGVPKPLPELPPEAPAPDCTQPAGCLFCEHHRDIDSADYVWSAASMHYLNTVILKCFRPPAKGKADAARHIELAIKVLAAKLKWFNDSNAKRKAWVEEATEKLAEREFHSHWRYLIESAQGI